MLLQYDELKQATRLATLTAVSNDGQALRTGVAAQRAGTSQ